MKFLLTAKLRSTDDDWRRECDEECRMRNVFFLFIVICTAASLGLTKCWEKMKTNIIRNYKILFDQLLEDNTFKEELS